MEGKVEVNGVNLWYRDSGEGKPVAQIHGAGFGHFNFDPATPELSKHFRVIDYDMRGYGQSDRPVQHYDMEVRKWRQDRRFRETWERRSVEKHISPERMQKVLDVLYQSAIGTGDVAAAKQYLLHTEKFLPPKQILRDASVAHMSDAELRSEVEAILASGFGAP